MKAPMKGTGMGSKGRPSAKGTAGGSAMGKGASSMRAKSGAKSRGTLKPSLTVGGGRRSAKPLRGMGGGDDMTIKVVSFEQFKEWEDMSKMAIKGVTFLGSMYYVPTRYNFGAINPNGDVFAFVKEPVDTGKAWDTGGVDYINYTKSMNKGNCTYLGAVKKSRALHNYSELVQPFKSAGKFKGGIARLPKRVNPGKDKFEVIDWTMAYYPCAEFEYKGVKVYAPAIVEYMAVNEHGILEGFVKKPNRTTSEGLKSDGLDFELGRITFEDEDSWIDSLEEVV